MEKADSLQIQIDFVLLQCLFIHSWLKRSRLLYLRVGIPFFAEVRRHERQFPSLFIFAREERVEEKEREVAAAIFVWFP